MSQLLLFTGYGSGTINNPLLLVNEQTDFDLTQPFDIRIDTNAQLEFGNFTYFKIVDLDTVYLLATLRGSSILSMRYDANKAVKLTLFGTDKTNITDGRFMFSQYDGIYYISKLQVFEDSLLMSDDVLQIATQLQLGIVKGSNDVHIASDGTMTTPHAHEVGNPHATKFDEIQDKPKTLSGYEITDAYTKEETSTIVNAAVENINTGPKVYISAEQPENMTIEDVWFAL